jgi:hypothetical protein
MLILALEKPRRKKSICIEERKIKEISMNT